MNGAEHEAHTLDALDALDSVMGGGLQGLAELLGQNEQNVKLCEPAPNDNSPRERVGRSLLLFGFAFLMVVVLTHVAEAFHILPAMGWGRPNSAGHYLDRASVILACVTLPLGFLAVVPNPLRPRARRLAP
jgi:hypothetical protein